MPAMGEAMTDMVTNLRGHLPSIDLDASAITDRLPGRRHKSKRRTVGLIAAAVGAAAVFGIVIRRRNSAPVSEAAMYTPPLPRP